MRHLSRTCWLDMTHATAARCSCRRRISSRRRSTVRAVEYNRALDGMSALNAGLERLFERYDAILTPAATGEAPVGEATGDPAFCTIWTYCGVPAITLPLLAGPNNMPVGVQLVGR